MNANTSEILAVELGEGLDVGWVGEGSVLAEA